MFMFHFIQVFSFDFNFLIRFFFMQSKVVEEKVVLMKAVITDAIIFTAPSNNDNI